MVLYPLLCGYQLPENGRGWHTPSHPFDGETSSPASRPLLSLERIIKSHPRAVKDAHRKSGRAVRKPSAVPEEPEIAWISPPWKGEDHEKYSND